MTFSASDAALEGFRITRARPQAALAWAAVQLVLILAVQAASVWLIGPNLARLATMTPWSSLSADEVLKLTPITFELLAIEVVFTLPACAFLYAAIDRAVLRPGEGGFGWLRLGMDELRQAGVLFCYWAVLAAAFLAGVMALSVLSIPLVMAMGAPGQFLALFFGLPAVAAFMAFIGVRLSLGPPATFERRRFVLFDTWGLTKGRFWPLVGAYVVSRLLCLLVLVLVMVIGSLFVSFVPGTDEAIPTTFAGLLSGKALLKILFQAVASGLAAPIAVAPAAHAYRQIAGSEEQARTFA